MPNNKRYIFVDIDGNRQLMCMFKCNFCPHLKIDKSTKMATCDNMKQDLELVRAYGYSVGGDYIPLSIINIPDSCNLPELVEDAIAKSPLTHIRQAKIISDKYVDYDRMMKLKSTNKINDVSSQKNRFSSNLPATIEKPKAIIKKDTCSCCGEEKENVKRDVNNGMCSDCFEKYRNDKDKLQFTFINNFRLKRDSTYSDKTFKIIQ